MMLSTIFKYFHILLLFTLLGSVSHATQIDTAKSWLSTEVNAGVLAQEQNVSSNALALASQSAKESALAFVLSDDIAVLDIQSLLFPFVQEKDENTTEYIANKSITNQKIGSDVSEMLSRLITLQNSDGGFGHNSCHQSNTLDTALALEALVASNAYSEQISKAVSYLLAKQLSDGSWQDVEGDKLYTTALTLRSLWLYRKSYDVQNAIDLAKSYILTQQKADGSYGDELYLSALALRSIAPLEYDKTNIQTTIDYLKNSQDAIGSWAGDIYTTALVLQSLLLADKEVPNPDTSTVKGVVTDGDTGLTLSDIEVRLEGDSNLTVTTSTDGTFVFAGLKNGSYTLSVLSSNYAPLHTTLNLSGSDVDLGVLRLNKNINATVSSLKGIVKDAVTQEALANVTLILGDQTVISASDGSYVFDTIEAGNYTMLLNKVGYRQKQQTLSISPNTILRYNPLMYTIDTSIEAAVKGQIVDKNTTLPLEGTTVTLLGTNANTITTAIDGRFYFSKLGEGDYALSISKIGYRSVTSNIQVRETTIYDYGSIDLLPVDPADTTVTLQGTVTQMPENSPIEGAVITVGIHSTMSDTLGEYTLTGLTAGTMHIEASKDGYTSVLANANPTEGSTLIFSPAMTKNDSNLSIFGTILDSNSSEPIENVRVEYMGESNVTVYTNAQGYYVINPVTAGDVTLSYTKLGYGTLTFDVAVETNSLNVSPLLNKITAQYSDNNASIFGEVRDVISNKTISDVNIIIAGVLTSETLMSNENGVFSLDNILSYDLNLTLEKDGYKRVETSLHLYKNEKFDIGIISMRPLSKREFIPDLTILDVNFTKTNIGQSELTLSTLVEVKLSNIGGLSTENSFEILAYYDVNKNTNYDEGIDTFLGSVDTNKIVDVDENITLSFPLVGQIPFVNAPITIWVDSKTDIIEINEENNVYAYNIKCGNVSSINTDNTQINRVKNAIVKGSDYIAPQTMSWDRRNRCLGCHVQTQTLVGLQASMAKAKVDTIAGEYLLAKILDSQQTDGSIRRSHSGYSKTQTAFALWSLSYVPDTNRTFNVRANALRYFDSKKQTNSNGIYWTVDHNTGWMNSTDAITAIISLSASRYIKDAVIQDSLSVLEQDIVEKYKNSLPSMAKYLLSRIKIDNNNITNALYMVGLSEAKRYVVDTSLYTTINTSVKELEQIMRNRQNSDGGWSYRSTGGASDPLTSAWVGFALNYQDITHTDQAVLKNIEYLLNSQKNNGTWVTNSGRFSTHLATTSLVMAYLPVALNFLDNADLSVSLLKLVEENGQLNLSARIGNGGSDKLRVPTSVSFYDGNPQTNGAFIVEKRINQLDKWNYIDILINSIDTPINGSIYAIVDAQNWITECNELNNYMNIPAIASQLNGSIVVSTDALNYSANQLVRLQGTSTNLGKLEANLTAQLILEDLNGNIIQAFDKQPLGIVPSQESRSINNEWSTTTTLSGVYVVHGILTDKEGNVVDESNSTFNIVSEQVDNVSATLDLSTDRVRYHTTDSIALNNFVQSVSSNSVIDEARVVVEIRDSNGTVVKTETLPTGDLLPLSSRDVPTTYDYSGLPVGEYHVEAALYGNGNVVFATDSKTITIYEDLSQALKGSVSVAWRSDTVGTTQQCSYSLSNFGTTALTGLPIALRMIDMNSSKNVYDFNTTVDINTSQTIEGMSSIDTHGFRAGEYSCALYAEVESAWMLIDSKPFALTNTPPVANDDNASTTQDESVSIDVLANDSDAEDGNVTLVSFTQPNHGTVTQTGNQLLYSPENGYVGTDSFGYTVTDTAGAEANATVIIEVKAPPIVLDGDLSEGDKGRLLVLVDPCQQSTTCGHGYRNCGCNSWLHGSHGSKRYKKSKGHHGSHGSKGSHGSHHGSHGQQSTTHCEEPNGPRDALDVNAQKAYLEALLSSLGYSYTIVDNANDFTAALRSGRYNQYVLLSETVTLSRTVQKELREAVYKGETLLMAGMHDNRNAYLSDISDVWYKGRYWSVDTVETKGDTLEYFETTLMDWSKPIRFTTRKASIIMQYNMNSCYGTNQPAAVMRSYGNGKVIYAGFDFLAEASKAPHEEYENALKEMLEQLHPNSLSMQSIVPIVLHVENQGIDTSVQMELNITGGTFIDALGSSELNATYIRFEEDNLTQESTKAYYLWATPNDNNAFVVNASIYSTNNASHTLQKELSFSKDIDTQTGFTKVMEEADKIELRYHRDRRKLSGVHRVIHKAQRAYRYHDYDRVLYRLLYSTDKLRRVREQEKIKALRVAIDRLIRTTEIEKTKAGE